MDFNKMTEQITKQMTEAGGQVMKKPDLSLITEIKATECCGRDAGEEFTDADACVQAGNGTAEPKAVKGIVVRCGYIMDSIQTLYETGEGTAYGCAHGGGEYRICFDQGDSLEKVEGCADISFGGTGVLSDIRITTKKGKKFGPFGTARSGSKICVEVPKNGEFAGFYGKHKKGCGLTKLGLLYFEKGEK